MPPVDNTKRSAMIAEGMTEGEADYMLSGGSNDAGLNITSDVRGDDEPPPAADTGAGDSNAAAAGQQQPAVDAADEDGPAPPQNSPFYARWQRDRRARQEAERTLQERTQALSEEREKWARLDERMRVFQQAMEQDQAQQQSQPRQKPDREADPFGYMQWMEEQLESLRPQVEQVRTQFQERDAATQLRDAYVSDAQQFARATPEFGPAYNWLMHNRDAELQAAGYTDANERMRIIAADERDIVARALQGRQSPAQVIYGLAKARGFAMPQQPAPTQPGAGNGQQPANGAARQPSVTEQVQNIQRGQSASRSLSSAGGSPPPQGINLESLANMTDAQYANWMKGLTVDQRQEYYGMIGYMGR